MRLSAFILFLATITSLTYAGEVENTIEPLGLTKEDLKYVWHSGRCAPDWSVAVEQEVLNDKNLLGYKGLNSNFFQRDNSGIEIVIRAGVKCVALNEYYFQHRSNIEIKEFIALDEMFTKKYGYSVLDAIYVENTQFYSWSGKISRFHHDYSKELSRKGLYSLKQKESEFNGKPSVSLSGERMAVGDQFHDNVFK